MTNTARWWPFTRSGSGVLRYTQSHRVDDPAYDPSRRGMEPPYDGVAEVWWESEEALAAASASDAGRRANAEVLADEAGFIDLPASPLWLAHEYPQINPGPEPLVAHPKSSLVKLHYPIRHPPTMTMEEAQTYWRTMHGPLVRSSSGAGGILRYIQVHRYESPRRRRCGNRGERKSSPTPAMPRRGATGRCRGQAPRPRPRGERPLRTKPTSSTSPGPPSGLARNTC